MSQLLQVATRKGTISVFQADPEFFDQGLPYVDAGQIAYENLGAIDHYHQGLPFTAAGRLAAVLNGIVARYGSGSAPFSVGGHLVFGTGGVDHYSAGIPYTVSGQIAVMAV